MPNRCSKAGHPVEVEPAQPEAFFSCVHSIRILSGIGYFYLGLLI